MEGFLASTFWTDLDTSKTSTRVGKEEAEEALACLLVRHIPRIWDAYPPVNPVVDFGDATRSLPSLVAKIHYRVKHNASRLRKTTHYLISLSFSYSAKIGIWFSLLFLLSYRIIFRESLHRVKHIFGITISTLNIGLSHLNMSQNAPVLC